jgi:hypothetical protein
MILLAWLLDCLVWRAVRRLLRQAAMRAVHWDFRIPGGPMTRLLKKTEKSFPCPVECRCVMAWRD